MEEKGIRVTCGRIVHYFPHVDEKVFQGSFVKIWGSKFAAIVTDDLDTAPVLSIFTGDIDAPVVVIKTVAHKSQQIQGQGYWDWPERQ